MSYRNQIKLLDVLKRYERKFESKEKQRYKMLVKRHKDDEDLDKLSMEFLETLHTKYHVNRERKNYDAFFKKPDEE